MNLWQSKSLTITLKGAALTACAMTVLVCMCLQPATAAWFAFLWVGFRVWRRRRRWHDARDLRHFGRTGRPRVPARLRRAVLRADGHACVFCGSTQRLELDHIRPWAHGGMTVMANLATLCHRCNMVKSDYYPGMSYHPWQGYESRKLANRIYRAEVSLPRIMTAA